jgi:toxin ParE1/3/4
MSDKPIVARTRARQDIESAVDHYSQEAGAEIANAFIDALETAYRAIGEYPAAGSPRYGDALALPGLRSRALGRFPYRIFYVERADHIDVWRVLDARRDIPTWLVDPEEI